MSDLVGNIGDNAPFWRSEYVYGDEDMPILMYNEDYDFGGYPLMMVGKAGNTVLVEKFPDNSYLTLSTGSTDAVRSLDVINSSFDYRHVAYGSQNGDVHIADIDNRTKLTKVTPFSGIENVTGMRYHHTNDWLAAAGGTIKVLDSSTDYSTIETVGSGPNDDGHSPAWTDDYLIFTSYTFDAFGTDDQDLVVVDSSDWSVVHTDDIGSGKAAQASVDRNNGWYAVDTGGQTSIYSTTSPWDRVATVPNTPSQVEFSPDGNWLSVGSVVYDTTDWTEAFAPSDAQTPIAFGHNNQLVGYCKVTSENNSTFTVVKFINIGSWTEESRFETSSQQVDGDFLMWFEGFYYE